MAIKTTDYATKYNVDGNGNLIPMSLTEVHQIGVNDMCVQTFGNIYKSLPLKVTKIVKYENINDKTLEFVEVSSDITKENQVKIDYINNSIKFHPSQKGLFVKIDYYSESSDKIGWGNIWTNIDDKGNVIGVLEDLIREGQKALEAISVIGGAGVIVEQIREYIVGALKLKDDIIEGARLHDVLTADVNIATNQDRLLKETIRLGEALKTTLDEWATQHSDIVNLDNRVGTVETTMSEEITKINRFKSTVGVSVLDFGAKGDGVTNSGKSINDAIIYANANGIKKVLIPSGTFVIETPVIVQGNITLEGMGQQTILKQKANTVLEAVVIHRHDFPASYNATIKNIKIDGNKENNTSYSSSDTSFVSNNGLKLKFSHYSNFENIYIVNCGCDGIVLTGDIGADWNKHCTTNFLSNIFTHNCGRYGLLLDTPANDNHFIHCDFGYSVFTNVLVSGGSNTIDSCVLWGSQTAKGLWINSQQTMIRNCQIEGNSQHGIAVSAYGSHSVINNCKFMSNSRSGNGLYPHIYVAGESATIVKNIKIDNNIFKGSSSDADGDGVTDRCISLEATHEGISINGNSMLYNSAGSVCLINELQVFGLKEKDTFNNVLLITDTSKPSDYKVPNGQLLQRLDTGYMTYVNPVTHKFVEIGGVEVTFSGTAMIKRYKNAVISNGIYVDLIEVTDRVPTSRLGTVGAGEGALFRRTCKWNLPITFPNNIIGIHASSSHWAMSAMCAYDTLSTITIETSSVIEGYAKLVNVNHAVCYTVIGY